MQNNDVITLSESRYRVILDNMMEGCAIVNFNEIYIYVNDAYAKKTRHKKENMLGKTIAEANPDSVKYGYYETYRKCLREKIPLGMEVSFPEREGKTEWYDIKVQPIPEGIFILSLDVTTRKNYEVEVQRRATEMDAVLNAIADGIYVYDNEGRIIRTNKAAEEIMKYNSNDLHATMENRLPTIKVSDEFGNVLSPEEMPAYRAAVNAEICKAQVFQVRGRGDEKWIIVSAAPMFIHGKHFGGVVSMTDITTRKNAQDALAKNQEILNLILDHINEGILVSDAPDARVAAISKWGLETTIAKNKDELFGLSVDKYLDQWDVRDVNTREPISHKDLPVAKAMKGEITHGQEMLIRQGNNDMFILANAVPIYNKDQSQIIHAVSTWTDITDRKKAEQSLHQALLDLKDAYITIEEKLKEREILLKEIYHRTKNNMQVISSLLSIKASTLENPEIQSVFREMQSRIRAIALVHEKLYKSENLSRISIKDYLRELVQILYHLSSSSQNNIQFNYDLEEINVSVDTAITCGLIVTELVLNSLKYAFPENKKGLIEVKLKKYDDNMVELIISDNGIGMQEQNEERGMGLLLFKDIAESQLNGTISLDTSKGVSWSVKFKGDQQ
jgi:PAS domain S-box-containing protein